jgi:hypothetical protein
MRSILLLPTSEIRQQLVTALLNVIFGPAYGISEIAHLL